MGACGVWGRADASLRFPPPPPPPAGSGSPRGLGIPPRHCPGAELLAPCWHGEHGLFLGVCSPQALLWGCCELSGVPSGECSSVHMGLGGHDGLSGQDGQDTG